MDISDYVNLDPIEKVYVESYDFYCKIHSTKTRISVRLSNRGFTKNGIYLEQVELLLVGIQELDTLSIDRPKGEKVMICRKMESMIQADQVIIIYWNKIYAIDLSLLHKIELLSK